MLSKLSIIIPAYKEYENLKILIPKIIEIMDKSKIVYEILIIDSFSTLDNTPNLVNEFNIVYKQREQNNNYSSAVKTGIKYASYNKVLFMDADGSHSPIYIPKMFEFTNKYDVVIGSRYIKNGSTENNFYLVSMSKLLNFIYSLLFNLHIYDVSNSFKIYPLDKLKLLQLDSKHFDVIEEILIKLKYYNKDLTIFETPIIFNKRIYGDSKRSFLIFVYSYFKTMILLLHWKVFGKK